MLTQLTAENSTFALKVPPDHTVAVLEQSSTLTLFSATNQKTCQDGVYLAIDFITFFQFVTFRTALQRIQNPPFYPELFYNITQI